MREENIFDCPEKLLIRDIGFRLACAYDDEQFYALNTLFSVTRKKVTSQLSLSYILSLLNSLFISKYFRERFEGAHIGSNYLRFKPLYTTQLPIRRVHFTTPKSERKKMFDALAAQYENGQDTALLVQVEHLLPKDADGTFLAFKPSATGNEEHSDVVHDLLAYLAERMIDLNKDKRSEMKRFLGWLEGALHIKPNNKGEEGLDALTGKSKLRNYLGDYQKEEAELSFAELEDILFKNRTRLGVSLNDARFKAKLQNEYEMSIARLRPIKQELARTDALIDQIVYRLYGLTEEEVSVVEGKAAEE